MDPWKSDQAMCIVKRIAQTNWLDDELRNSPSFWDVCAKESCEKIKNATPRSGFQVKEMLFCWLDSNRVCRRGQVNSDYAGFEIWTAKEIDALFQKLKSSPNIFERVKTVWKGPHHLLVRLKKFDEIAKDFNRQSKLKVLCGAKSYYEQQQVLKSREYNYDGNAFETLCQMKRDTVDLGGPERHKRDVDFVFPFECDNNNKIDSTYIGQPKKHIFAGYSFLLGYRNEKFTHVLAREALKDLIFRNGGTVEFGPPAEGLNFSVTIWRTSSSKTKNGHLCHHSSIYDAVKKREFNFAKHLKHSSQDECVTEYFGVPIAPSDSVKSRATNTTGAKRSATGATPTNALKSKDNVKRTDAVAVPAQGTNVEKTSQRQSVETKDQSEPAQVPPIVPSEIEHNTSTDKEIVVSDAASHKLSAKKEDGIVDKDENDAVIKLKDPEKKTSSRQPGTESSIVDNSDAPEKNAEPELDNGICDKESDSVGKTDQHASLQKASNTGKLITIPSPDDAGSRTSPPSKLSAIEKLEQLSQSQMSSKTGVSQCKQTEFLYDFERFQEHMEEESRKDRSAVEVENAASHSSDEEWIEPPRKVMALTKPEPNPAALDLETFRKSFDMPNDDLIYMSLKWFRPDVTNRANQLKFLIANEKSEFEGFKFDTVRMKVSRAIKKTDRVKLIATKCGFSEVVLEGFLNLWSVSTSDSSQN